MLQPQTKIVEKKNLCRLKGHGNGKITKRFQIFFREKSLLIFFPWLYPRHEKIHCLEQGWDSIFFLKCRTKMVHLRKFQRISDKKMCSDHMRPNRFFIGRKDRHVLFEYNFSSENNLKRTQKPFLCNENVSFECHLWLGDLYLNRQHISLKILIKELNVSSKREKNMNNCSNRPYHTS